MTFTQGHSFKSKTGDTDKSHNFDIATAVQEQRLTLTMSELMGCNYVFVTPLRAQALFTGERMASSIQELVSILEINPHQTVIILINNNADNRFTRLEFTWKDGRAEQMNTLAITTNEQIDFMEMMLDCSTLY